MTRTMMIAGVNLDKAWTDLGPGLGAALRDWSRQVLALTVDEAGRRGAELLVVLGGLVDRSAALPDTVDYAAQVLGSFSGQVLVVPGPADWTDGNGLYALQAWAPNTTVLNSASFELVVGQPGVMASAWTSPVGSTPRLVPDATGPARTLLRPSLTQDQAEKLRDHGRVATTGAASEAVLSVPDLVRAPGTEGGWGLIIDLDEADAEGERVHLPQQPGRTTSLDMSGLRDPAEFAEALTTVGQEAGPVVVSLTGSLGPSMLLPGFGGPEIPTAVVLDLSGLRYAVETPEPSDRSTRAEFLRAMSTTRGDERERHQTTALGLRALESSAVGA
jgi:hypothetical protein